MLGISIGRLPEAQQRNVGHALEAHFNAKPKPKYVAAVMSSAEAVIAATAGLGETAGPTLFVIDRKTDTVVSCILRLAQTYQKALSSSLVPRTPEQDAMLEAAQQIEEIWFPGGVTFIHGSASDQNAAMTLMRKALHEGETAPVLQSAIETLGLGPLVDFFISHAQVYARKLGVSGEAVDGEKEEPVDPSDRWHEAFVRFAIDVYSAYRDKPAIMQTLLGGYESQLAEHRAEQARLRKKEREAEAKAKAEAEAKAKAEPKPK